MLKISYGHQVVDSVDKNTVGPYSQNQISVQTLEQIMQNHKPFNPSTAKQQIHHQKNEYLLLTFDDGYRDNLTKLLPLLEKYDYHAVIFVTTSFIEGSLPYELKIANIVNKLNEIKLPEDNIHIKEKHQKANAYDKIRKQLKKASARKRQKRIQQIRELNNIHSETDNKLMLNWQQLQQLDNHELVTIGAHGHKHEFYRSMRPYRAYHNTKKSKDILENKLAHKIKAFAYPYGAHNILIEMIIKLIGFEQCFTTQSGSISTISDFYSTSIPRVPIKNLA